MSIGNTKPPASYRREPFKELAIPLRHSPGRRLIVTGEGHIMGFPGIVRGWWTNRLALSFDFDAARVDFPFWVEETKDGYLCFWEIQPDGRYWADEGGYGMEHDDEIILCAAMDAQAQFREPFRVCRIGGKPVGRELALCAWDSALEAAWKQQLARYTWVYAQYLCGSASDPGFKTYDCRFRLPGVPGFVFLSLIRDPQEPDMRAMLVAIGEHEPEQQQAVKQWHKDEAFESMQSGQTVEALGSAITELLRKRG